MLESSNFVEVSERVWDDVFVGEQFGVREVFPAYSLYELISFLCISRTGEYEVSYVFGCLYACELWAVGRVALSYSV